MYNIHSSVVVSSPSWQNMIVGSGAVGYVSVDSRLYREEAAGILTRAAHNCEYSVFLFRLSFEQGKELHASDLIRLRMTSLPVAMLRNFTFREVLSRVMGRGNPNGGTEMGRSNTNIQSTGGSLRQSDAKLCADTPRTLAD
jgi:hypothetical protein